jgi:uncharacterized protein
MSIIVVLDTNILTVPAQFSVDIFAESERVIEGRVEFIVLRSVIQELEKKLDTVARTEKFKFRIALDLVNRCTIIEPEEFPSSSSVDDQVLEYAIATNGVLATNDRGLRERCIQKGVPVIFLRGKKRLELIGTVR